MTFDGRPLTAEPGQSVGAALTEAGVKSWRSTRVAGKPRGLFCGIGICFDCLLTIDAVPNQRACLAPAQEGMQLESGVVGTASASTSAPAGTEKAHNA
ncbi:MAG: (2Fe-2S)-binding protein [Actinomycetota bacterium]|nr:(2Fe-2S)-binding protein [Actinomycetota bacterium]